MDLIWRRARTVLWFHGHARHTPRPARARSQARGVLRHLRAMGGARPSATDRRRARRVLFVGRKPRCSYCRGLGIWQLRPPALRPGISGRRLDQRRSTRGAGCAVPQGQLDVPVRTERCAVPRLGCDAHQRGHNEHDVTNSGAWRTALRVSPPRGARELFRNRAARGISARGLAGRSGDFNDRPLFARVGPNTLWQDYWVLDLNANVTVTFTITRR